MGVTAEISKQQRHRQCKNPNSAENIPNTAHAAALTTPENPPGNPNFSSPRTRVTHLRAQLQHFVQTTGLSNPAHLAQPWASTARQKFLCRATGTPKIAAPAPAEQQIQPKGAGPALQGSPGFSHPAKKGTLRSAAYQKGSSRSVAVW